MKKIIFAALFFLWGSLALAQTSPNLIQNQVLTPEQWNALFTAKQDYLGAPPLLITGGTMTGSLNTNASTSVISGFNIPPGVAPTTPNNGDIWTTSAGIFVQINGGTVGPLLSAATPCSACALTNNANNFSVAQVVNINGGPLATALTGTVVRAASANSVSTRFEADAYGATSYFSAVAYGGTLASPTALGSGVEIGGVNGWGYNGTAVVGPSAAFRLFTNGIWSGTSQPTYADIAVTPSGSTTEIEAAKFTASGTAAVNAQIGTPGSIVGTISLANATSGTISLSPAAGALGSSVATLPIGTYNVVGDTLIQPLTNKTISSSSDVLGGVTMTLGSDATGDVYYRNSSGILTRLGIGGSANVLTVSGGLPVWAAAAGGGNVSNTGTPTANQFALWTNTTTIEGVTATAHAIVIGEGTNAPNYVGPGTVGQFDAAQGASADPLFVSGPKTLIKTTTVPAAFTITFTNGSAVISGTNSFVQGQPVQFTTTGALPTNFSTSANFFVLSTGLSGSQFEVASTPGGTAIVAGSAGSGTQTANPVGVVDVSSITSTYSEYEILAENCGSASTQANLGGLLFMGGAWVNSGYSYALMTNIATSPATFAGGGGNGVTSMAMNRSDSNLATIHFYTSNPSAGTGLKMLSGIGGSQSTTSGAASETFHGYTATSTGALQGISFFAAAAPISYSCTLKIYGWQ